MFPYEQVDHSPPVRCYSSGFLVMWSDWVIIVLLCAFALIWRVALTRSCRRTRTGLCTTMLWSQYKSSAEGETNPISRWLFYLCQPKYLALHYTLYLGIHLWIDKRFFIYPGTKHMSVSKHMNWTSHRRTNQTYWLLFPTCGTAF